jgi:hypothetical protein
MILMSDTHANADKAFLVSLTTMLEQRVVVIIGPPAEVATGMFGGDVFPQVTSRGGTVGLSACTVTFVATGLVQRVFVGKDTLVLRAQITYRQFVSLSDVSLEVRP